MDAIPTDAGTVPSFDEIVERLEFSVALLPNVLKTPEGMAALRPYAHLIKPVLAAYQFKPPAATAACLDRNMIAKMLTGFLWFSYIDNPVAKQIILTRFCRRASSAKPPSWRVLGELARCSPYIAKRAHEEGIERIRAKLASM